MLYSIAIWCFAILWISLPTNTSEIARALINVTHQWEAANGHNFQCLVFLHAAVVISNTKLPWRKCCTSVLFFFFFNKGIALDWATSESFKESVFWKVLDVYLLKIRCLFNLRSPQCMHKKHLRMLFLPSQETTLTSCRPAKELAGKFCIWHCRRWVKCFWNKIFKATVSHPWVNVPYWCNIHDLTWNFS